MPSVAVAPGESIQDAITAAGAGGTVTVQPGTYTYFTLPASVTGALGAPTTVRSATKWGARIVAPAGQHGILVSDGCNYAVIDGFRVSDGPQDGIKTNADNTTIQNNWVHNNSGQGINAIGAASFVCDSNLVENNGTDPALEHGIYLNTVGGTIRNNIVRNNSAYGIHCYTPEGLTNVSVYGNVTYGNGSGGILMQGPGAAACGNSITCNSVGDAPIKVRSCNGAVVANNLLLVSGTSQTIDYSQDGATPSVSTVLAANYEYLRSDRYNTHSTVNTNEILTNGNFETTEAGGTAFANWVEAVDPTGTSAVIVNNTQQDTGTYCCQLSVDANGKYCKIAMASATVVGAVYTLTFRAKASVNDATMLLENPAVAFTLSTAYRTYSCTFTAASTWLTLIRGEPDGQSVYIDNVSLKRAYGPQVHSAANGMYWPMIGSGLIDAGSNTYKPAADFWGQTPPTTVQIGAFPYTEKLHPRTMLHDPWDLTKVRRRWWNWRRREQNLKPA